MAASAGAPAGTSPGGVPAADRPRTVGWLAVTSATDLPAEEPGHDAAVEEAVAALLEATGARGERGNRHRLLTDLVRTAAGIAGDHVGTLDLKIATSALHEMRDAFRMFAPYADVPKVTIFGSARVRPDEPLYDQAREVAARLARQGWFIITGAGPGIMAAGHEGAGRENSMGVAIRLPFEQSANAFIAGDTKYVTMKYFFTRKLMLIKESKGFVCLPGGFGTLDETFELLTLTQTGKGLPVPIVFLEAPGDTYWDRAKEFMRDELASRGLIDTVDIDLALTTESPEEAADAITGFYANFDSIRYVGADLVVRLRHAPDDATLDTLTDRYRALITPGGRMVRSEPTTAETRDRDVLHLERIRFPFARHGFGQLRSLIADLNAIAEPVVPVAPSATPSDTSEHL
jgi:uncharacterized protein (TIGR00730 family)